MPAIARHGEETLLEWLRACKVLFLYDREAGKAFIRGSPAVEEVAKEVVPWTRQAVAFTQWSGAVQALAGFMRELPDAYRESFSLIHRPRVLIGIPSGVTEVEKRAVIDATLNAGARAPYLIDEPMAAAIGARLPVADAAGNMLVDIGGETLEIAVISLGGVVACRSLRVAGDEMNEDIIRYCRDEFNMMIGEKTAEDVKIGIGSAFPLDEPLSLPIRGRDLVSGLPKEMIVSDEHIREALSRSIRIIVNNIKTIIEETPPELLSDIMQKE